MSLLFTRATSLALLRSALDIIEFLLGLRDTKLAKTAAEGPRYRSLKVALIRRKGKVSYDLAPIMGPVPLTYFARYSRIQSSKISHHNEFGPEINGLIYRRQLRTVGSIAGSNAVRLNITGTFITFIADE